MTPRAHHSRGTSLMETMVAGAVLIVGLTGITEMLMRGAVIGRNGQQAMTGAHYANQALDEIANVGFNGLTPMPGASFAVPASVADGGVYIDGSNRTFLTTYIVTDIGAPWPTYRLDVQTQWRDGNGQLRTYLQSTVLSKAPDAG